MARSRKPTGLIDTDILIDAERGVVDAVNFLSARQSSAGVHISIISAMELVEGARNAGELAAIQQFLAAVVVVPLTVASSKRALQLMESFRLSYGLLLADSLIGATALEHGVALYTKNVRHFQMIPHLQTLRPY